MVIETNNKNKLAVTLSKSCHNWFCNYVTKFSTEVLLDQTSGVNTWVMPFHDSCFEFVLN